jgi:hypothetical protein
MTTTAGPNFFDLQDDNGNTLVYTGGGKSALQKLDWSLARYTNFFTVPSEASDLMSSAYMFFYPSVDTVAYRCYWDQDPASSTPLGVGWVTNTQASAGAPALALTPTQLIPAKGCGYYVKQGALYMQKPDPKTGVVIYGAKPLVWNLKPTTGQAFLLQNPVDGSYVSLSGTNISSTKTITSAAVFEYVNGYIVVYNTFDGTKVTIIDVGLTPTTFTVSSTTLLTNIAEGLGSNGYNVLTPGVLTNGKYYLGMPSSTSSQFVALTDASKGLVPVQPPISMVSPSVLYIYAYGKSAKANYANPTPYAFVLGKACKTSKKLSTAAIAGIVAAAVVVLAIIIALAVVYSRKKKA